MDNQFNKLALLCAALTLTACNGLQFKTNLSPALIVEQHKAHQVTEYSAEVVYSYDSEMIGDVSASYCQTLSAPPPSYSGVVSALKQKVVHLGGNGIVVMECSKENPFGTCQARLECRALAYTVNFP